MTNGFNTNNSFLGGSWLQNSQIHVSNNINKQNEIVIDVVEDNKNNDMQNKNENKSEEKKVNFDIENNSHHESNSNHEIEIIKNHDEMHENENDSESPLFNSLKAKKNHVNRKVRSQKSDEYNEDV